MSRSDDTLEDEDETVDEINALRQVLKLSRFGSDSEKLLLEMTKKKNRKRREMGFEGNKSISKSKSIRPSSENWIYFEKEKIY